MKSSGFEELFEGGKFPLKTGPTLNSFLNVEGYVSQKDRFTESPPEHLPQEIERIFREAEICTAVRCWNAAGAMFRTTIDLATKRLLPTEDSEGAPNRRIRRDLGLRLPWLFENGLLPTDLQELSSCIREDGNDGVHEGTLGQADAEDMRDFTRALLDRLYTQPARLRLAEERRIQRRTQKSS